MMTDPIADFLTRIRNALMAGFDSVETPASKMRAGICRVLKEEGYIKSFKVIVKSSSDIRLKIVFKKGAIVGLKRISTPGLRRYRGYRMMPRVLSGLGVGIISTSKGVVSSRKAREMKVGGEILCHIW